MRYQVGDQPIPGYRLDAFLGAGSYGEVWRAIGPGGVPCALKFISLDSKSGLKEFRSIRLVKRLQHPNLCPVQAIWLRDPDGNVLSDSGDDSISIRLMGPKELVIAMGLGQKSLAQRLDEVRIRGGVPARELLRYMSDASKGIDYLNSPEHDLGSGPASIIHCDIKPANLLVVGGGVQVCDYGVAKALAPDSKKTFAAGTPAYAAPELINNEPCAQTDQYSLAVTYYELRTGRLPFDEARAIVANLMGQLDFSGVGPDEQEVLRQATHKQPSKRFESCEEFVESLKVAANITIGPSGVIPASQARRAAAAPPPEEVSAAQPAPIPAAAKSLSDLLQPGGELVPDHYLTKLLGRGGYGEVWEARASGGVRCALKVVRDLQGRGKQEFAVLETISKLDHPSLVQLRGYWLLSANGSRVMAHQVGLTGVPDPSIVVISTDLAEKNLLDRLKECKADGLPGVPPDELVNHIRQAAVALDYLNIKHHIQHRDVKPENLLLRGDRLLVSDFGLAKLVEGDDGAVQSSSSGMTLEYAAPELLQKKVSSRTDQYSLALTYYTLRTGRMPFPPGMGQFDTMQARIKGQLDLSGVPEAEQAVLRKALAPNPADRFGSCDELARQLAHASGIGTGSLPSLASGGPDLSRITPTDLSPRMTPLIRSRASKTTPNYPIDTPRASARPGDVPLTPADSGGTLLFGDLPPEHQSSGPRTTPSPWVADDVSAKPTKSGRREPTWNEAPTAPSGGTGRTVAVVSGVVILLALAAAGVYSIVNKGGSGTVTVSTGVGTPPTDKGNGTGVATVSTSRAPDNRVEKITSLKAEIQRLVQAKQFESAWERVGELRGLDKAEASQLAVVVKTAEEKAKTPPQPGNRIAKAAAFFQPGQRDIPAGLEALAKVPESSADYPRAVALRAAWERAKTAATVAVTDTAGLLKFRDDYADLRPLTNSEPLIKSDRDHLQTYYRELLSAKVRSAIPGLSDKWADVAAICDEAAKATHVDSPSRAWIAACRMECRAEQNTPHDESDEAAKSKVEDPELAGYVSYVTALRNWRDGTDTPGRLDEAAQVAATLVPKDAPKESSWFSPRRLGRLADLLWSAHEPLRTADDKDLEHPYATGPAAENAAAWLTAASHAVELAHRPATDRTRFDYELLLANWSQGKGMGDELARLIDAKFETSLDPAPRARFGVIRATSRPADEVTGYQSALDALRIEGSPALRDFVARKVLTRLLTNKGIDQQAGGSELLASAGRELFRHRRAWTASAKLPDPPVKIAAGLFERAASQSKKADDRAWVGLCRMEVPGTPFSTLTSDLAEARKAGTGPAVQTLDALIAIRRPWADGKTFPSRAKETDNLKEAEGLLRKAIASCKSDKVNRSDELGLLFNRTTAVVARLAEESPSDQAEKQLKVLSELATEAQAGLARLEYAGRAHELRAKLLKPTKRFDSVAGEYALADRVYDWSGGLFGTARSAMNRGRNLVRWADDQFHNGGASLDEARLDRAEELLRRTTDPANKNIRPEELAEANYWLGRSTLLRCENAEQPLTRSRLVETALASFRLAAESAATLDVDYLSDAILRSALRSAEQGLKAARDAKSETTAEAIAKRIDGLIDRKAGRPLPPVWIATFKIHAIRVRELYGAKAGDWFGKIENAARPGLTGNRDRDDDLKLDLLQTLAEGYGAKEKNPKQFNLKSAIQHANEALDLVKSSKDLPKGKRIESYGLLGMLQYKNGNDENKYKPWADAQLNLDEALRLLAAERKADGQGTEGKRTFADEWKWRFALGGILAQTSADEKDPAKAADMGTRACWLQMPGYIAVYGFSKAARDPDDRALAERFFTLSSVWFTSARNASRLGVQQLPNDSRWAAWRMADAELTYILGTPEERKAESKKLAEAVKAVTARLKELPPEAKPEVEAQLARVKRFVPAE